LHQRAAARQADPAAAAFATFAARVARRPQQVLRYCFEEGARPLWPGVECVPRAADVPPCPLCGAPRRFEFQVRRARRGRAAFCACARCRDAAALRTGVAACVTSGGRGPQVLPQLLNWLEAGEAGGAAGDWGAIAVYSCPASCPPPADAESAYVEEFAWVQPP